MATYTTDKCTGGTASASSDYGGVFPATNGFDNNASSLWHSSVSAFPHWIKYDFGSGVSWAIVKLTLKCQNWGDGATAKDFTLQGSSNDSTWTTVYTGQTANNTDTQTFTFTNTTAYRYYKVNITSNWRSGGETSAGLFEVEMMASADIFVASAITGTATIGSAAKVTKRISSAVTPAAIITSNVRTNRKLQAVVVSANTVTSNLKAKWRIASAVNPAATVGSAVKVNRRVSAAVSLGTTVTSNSKVSRKLQSAVAGASVITSLARLNKRSYSDVISLATVSSTSRVQRLIQSAISAAAIVGSFIRVNLSFAGEVIANSVVTSAIKVQRNIQSAIQSDSAVVGNLVSTWRTVANVVANSEVTSALTQISPSIGIASNVIANSIVSAGLRANYSLKAAIVSVSNFGSLLTLLSGETSIGTFYLHNNTLIAKTGADTGTYHIIDNATNIRVGGTYIPILPFNYPYFSSCTDGIVTLNLQIAA